MLFFICVAFAFVATIVSLIDKPRDIGQMLVPPYGTVVAFGSGISTLAAIGLLAIVGFRAGGTALAIAFAALVVGTITGKTFRSLGDIGFALSQYVAILAIPLMLGALFAAWFVTQ